MPHRRAISFLLVLLTLAGLALGTPTTGLSAGDIAKIKQIHKKFEDAWLKVDADGMRLLFTEDCVLLPHHGDPARVGMKEMNQFWFPVNGPPTTVTKLRLILQGIGGDGRIAYVWGTHEVAWTTVQNGKATSSSNKGTFLNILRKQPNGDWKISHHMWDDPVGQQR
ncbi:MAG TPA: nuclear transport factor 2 family protein [Candidatus Dormibacteraeota bacterium]|nr:nuclear transport factor 2 family protein [Candidatus Dormibacteraeota bacterium]